MAAGQLTDRNIASVLSSAAEGYVQHVDHVTAGVEAESVRLDIRSCHRHTLVSLTLELTFSSFSSSPSYVSSPLC